MKARLIAFLDRNFQSEEINGERCPTYLYRWELMRIGKFFAIYLHQFVRNDWSLDLHDHPKRFISIGLKGRYIEQTPISERLYRAPWIRTFPSRHIHRLKLVAPDEECWTAVIVLRPVRKWGFWHGSQFIPWKEYVGGTVADEMRDC